VSENICGTVPFAPPIPVRGGRVCAAVLCSVALAACGSAVAGSGSTSAPGSTTSAGHSASAPASTAEGKQIFISSGCGGCHTLAAAGSHGNVGPNLDSLKPSYAAVLSQVTNGGGGMPSFKGQLSAKQISAVAHYVASVA
jgi:mono/diheme cytochrome c family protein